MVRLLPVHATNALRCASLQSVVPSSWRIARELIGDLGAMRREVGVVDVIFWYKNGIPRVIRLIGFKSRNVETVLSGSPVRPMRVPRRV
jgi:hypothetical protein